MCEYPEWWRFNIYIIVAGYDIAGNRVSFDNFTDKVYEIGFGTDRRQPPVDYNPLRPVGLAVGPCEYVEVYVYVVVNTFPDSAAIKDSPPFEAVLKVMPEGGEAQERSYDVNQWGGLTVVAEKFSKQG